MRLLVFLLAAVSAFAASPFDGTWKADLNSAEFPQRPDKVEIANGIYSCFSCSPPFKIKADGTDQKVTGTPVYDTMNVKVIDAHSASMTIKKDGKILGAQTVTVDETGNRSIRKIVQYPPNSKTPVDVTVVQVRVEKGAPGSHLLSGAWRTEKEQDVTAAALTTTYKVTTDEVSVTNGGGVSYTAKFDGKDYPLKGDLASDTVAVKRVDANTIEETTKKAGKVVVISRLTVSADGRLITVVSEDKLGGGTTKFMMMKQ